jgi:hypothetical protein
MSNCQTLQGHKRHRVKMTLETTSEVRTRRDSSAIENLEPPVTWGIVVALFLYRFIQCTASHEVMQGADDRFPQLSLLLCVKPVNILIQEAPWTRNGVRSSEPKGGLRSKCAFVLKNSMCEPS